MMITLSEQTVVAYTRRMDWAQVPEQERDDYLRWVRFYLDFCQKYGHPPRDEGSIAPFLAKLAFKKQSEPTLEQAARAVQLLLKRVEKTAGSGSAGAGTRSGVRGVGGSDSGDVARASLDHPLQAEASPPSSAWYGASWEAEYRELEGAIRLRNYSGKTLEVYRMWLQKFQAFTKSKPPGGLDAEDVKGFLTHLAVSEGVAASTQNQAFNALLFFYRHVLRREFGKLEGVVRAKRRRYIPVVLSWEEVDAVIARIDPLYRLAALLLYGCGLRLKECLELRIQCFNLDARLLTIHDGKGQKDRTVPLPERILPEIREQMERVRQTLLADVEAGFAGTFLPRLLDKKFKNAAKEFRWQWFFPATTLTKIPDSKERRRYHLHDTHMQAAVKRAADAAGMTKRVSPHTFRHTFASHLLLAGYDLPTIQRLLGHGDVKTTMIYVQTVPSRTLKDARSPLDLLQIKNSE